MEVRLGVSARALQQPQRLAHAHVHLHCESLVHLQRLVWLLQLWIRHAHSLKAYPMATIPARYTVPGMQIIDILQELNTWPCITEDLIWHK